MMGEAGATFTLKLEKWSYDRWVPVKTVTGEGKLTYSANGYPGYYRTTVTSNTKDWADYTVGATVG